MIGRIETFLRRWRRRFSRSEWMARLLKLPTSGGPPGANGLVLIQVDGLAHPQLEKALARGEMPFLKRLLKKEHYHLDHLYSGVPATTPAVQAEIFYGVRAAVPAFGFMMRDTQELVRMYEPDTAIRVEEQIIAQSNDPLLKGGSCYLSLFRAGAANGEAHFCPAAEGWGPAMRNASPLTVALLLLGNVWGLVRTAALLVVETVLALVDFVRGIIQGHNLVHELLFIPTRVAVTILMREMCTAGVKIDIARGLPIIYVNLLGYDEQSHRRGPSSAFAHWTLKGIDDAIGRIWRAAHRSERRHYDVWIYSDHGQEDSQPYENLHGRSFADAVSQALAQLPTQPGGYRSSGRRGVQLQRARFFGGERIQKFFRFDDQDSSSGKEPQIALAAMGPVALLYNVELNGTEPSQIARLLVEQTKAPLVLCKPKDSSDAQVNGWSIHGAVQLPRDAALVLGENHPFLQRAAEDLARLCHHPDAGDFVICGYCAGHQYITFASENGSHGGAGPNETHAFALLPPEVPRPHTRQGHRRPEDLRSAAMAFLRDDSASATARRAVKTLRVMTYNVHSCRGVDGRLSPRRIARIIARYSPDIVALQELDVRRERTGGVDQAEQIARLLAMEYHFHPAVHLQEERYGDAILTHLPLRLIKSDILPGPPNNKFNRLVPAADEPRGALWVEVDHNGDKVHILNTHLGLSRAERLRQVDALLGPEWLGHPRCKGSRILLGDFNALPSSMEYRRLSGHLQDAQLHLPNHRPQGTYFSRMPKARIDHIFIDRQLKVSHIFVPKDELARLASDHLPLIVDLVIGEEIG